MFYSWNYGLVHFVVVNTETDFKGAGYHERLFKAGGFLGAQGENAPAESPLSDHRTATPPLQIHPRTPRALPDD